MAYNNYGGGYNRSNSGGYNSRPQQNRGYSAPAPQAPEEIRAMPLPKDYVDEAERVMRTLSTERNKITTSKIRNLLSLVSDIYNTENLRTEKELLPESVTALTMMRIRVVYEAGREDAVKSFVRESKLLQYIKGIGTDREALIAFAHYMEALVAYHRFIIGGREG